MPPAPWRASLGQNRGAVSGHDGIHRPDVRPRRSSSAVHWPDAPGSSRLPGPLHGPSRQHTESDLRCYLAWCAARGLDPLTARRPHLELYLRWVQEIRHFKPSTVSRRSRSRPGSTAPASSTASWSTRRPSTFAARRYLQSPQPSQRRSLSLPVTFMITSLGLGYSARRELFLPEQGVGEGRRLGSPRSSNMTGSPAGIPEADATQRPRGPGRSASNASSVCNRRTDGGPGACKLRTIGLPNQGFFPYQSPRLQTSVYYTLRRSGVMTMTSGHTKGFWHRVRNFLLVQLNPSYADPDMDTPERAAEKKNDPRRFRPKQGGADLPMGPLMGGPGNSMRGSG